MQISAKNLTGTTEVDILNQLYRLLADLRSPQEVQAFISSFMTETERLVFAKRLAVAWLLEQGFSYEEIGKQLNVSSATISSAAVLRHKPEMKGAYRKLFLATWTRVMFRKLQFWHR
jgi:uncharacterized protein YerC